MGYIFNLLIYLLKVKYGGNKDAPFLVTFHNCSIVNYIFRLFFGSFSGDKIISITVFSEKSQMLG